MQTQQIGTSDLQTSVLAYGCMKIARGKTDNESLKNATQAVMAAIEASFTLFDHADIYGRTKCEEVFGKILKSDPSLRDNMIIATKCGIRGNPHRWDFSCDHIVWSCEQSLKRLNIETIDIYQLHRPDFLADPEEICHAFCELRASGKVRHFGVSNMRPSQLAMISKALPFPLVVNQVQTSLLHQDCLDDGTLDQCISENMTPLAWAPVAGGILAGKELPDDIPDREAKQALLDKMDEIAEEHGVGRDAVALAWLRKHPSRIIPIIGTTKPDRIHSAAVAAKIELSREHWYELLVSARGQNLP